MVIAVFRMERKFPTCNTAVFLLVFLNMVTKINVMHVSYQLN